MDNWDEILKRIQAEVMPEVHRQVKVYEDALANGTLKPLPQDTDKNKNVENGTHNTL